MKEKAKKLLADCRHDLRYRALVTLYINFAIHAGYAVFEAICGYLLRSAWMGTLAFYYIVLSTMRLFLLVRRKQEDPVRRWATCRTCGVVMLLLTVAMAGMHILTMRQSHTIEYRGYMIYAVAAYTFFVAVTAIRNVIIYHKMNDPLLSAGKAINLVVAAVSMYSLQSAMIGAFGNGDEHYRILMSNCVGGGVLVVIVSTAIFMIVKGHRRARQAAQDAAIPGGTDDD